MACHVSHTSFAVVCVVRLANMRPHDDGAVRLIVRRRVCVAMAMGHWVCLAGLLERLSSMWA